MGNCWCSFRRRGARRQIVLILIGLDNAGKTQTVNNLAGEKDDKVLPTVGFKAVNLIHKDTPVTIYDLGGGPHFRQIWSQYYSEVHGVIFVIDSSDFTRLDECRAVLEEVLSHDKISGKPVLVLANKQDLSGALDDIDVVDKLNIEPLVNRYRCPTLVESYTCVDERKPSKKPKIDPGLRKGYHWLLNYIIRRYGDINLRVQTDIHAELERRKRMQNKASNTTSLCDEIATQTGFENPTYDLDKTTVFDKSKKLEGLIIVKPITTSVDSTITIESIDSGNTSVKPKLSPLFGRSSNSNVTDTVRIELEPRSEFRKLSPIVRNKSGANQHIDFMNRPQSSPTMKKTKKQPPSINSSTQEHDSYGDRNRTWDGARNRTWDGARNRTWDGALDRKRVADADARARRELVLTDRDYKLSESKPYSDVTLARGSQPAALAPRPASACALVRSQLEHVAHRRRLSLRYMQRNKTSPERVSMMVLETKHRHLDKGDCEHAHTIN